MGTFALKSRSSKDKPESQGRAKDSSRLDGSPKDLPYGLLAEDAFIRTLCLERKRSERSAKPFVLMLLDAAKLLQTDKKEKVLRGIVSALSSAIRETDTAGWYKNNSVIGVLFTEIGVSETRSILAAIHAKASNALQSNLDLRQIGEIEISFHLFPEEEDKQNPGRPANAKLYPDLLRQDDPQRFPRLIKRAMDIVGGVLALIFFSPLFLVISLVIKLSSKGPILFRQERVGQYGITFTFLKFRTMYSTNDHSIHKEYVKRFISGDEDFEQANRSQNGVYKITEDPRVTHVGKFLRKSSLDELPQFWNVLKGEMSLVGPRPPIRYELESYDIWHRRRVLEAKPGITGLWQVHGRSKTTFEDMVRLDLRYAQMWSLWLDIKILIRTPQAVFSGEGAY